MKTRETPLLKNLTMLREADFDRIDMLLTNKPDRWEIQVREMLQGDIDTQAMCGNVGQARALRQWVSKAIAAAKKAKGGVK